MILPSKRSVKRFRIARNQADFKKKIFKEVITHGLLSSFRLQAESLSFDVSKKAWGRWATKGRKGAKQRALLRLNPYVKFMRGQLVRACKLGNAGETMDGGGWRVDRGEIGVELSLCKLPTKL